MKKLLLLLSICITLPVGAMGFRAQVKAANQTLLRHDEQELISLRHRLNAAVESKNFTQANDIIGKMEQLLNCMKNRHTSLGHNWSDEYTGHLASLNRLSEYVQKLQRVEREIAEMEPILPALFEAAKTSVFYEVLFLECEAYIDSRKAYYAYLAQEIIS